MAFILQWREELRNDRKQSIETIKESNDKNTEQENQKIVVRK